MLSSPTRLAPLATAILTALVACHGAPDDPVADEGPQTSRAADDGRGDLRIVIHDKPTSDVDEVWIAWSSVRVRADDGTWLDIPGSGTADLLSLQNGAVADLGLGTVPTGTYDQVRFVLTDAHVVVDGQDAPLTVPSGGSSGLKVKIEFAVEDCGETTVSIDWDAAAHLSLTPQGYRLRPVLTAESAYDDASCDLCAGAIAFPDPALEAAMRDELSIPTGPITGVDMQGPGSKFLFLQNRGITDLTGLECAGETPEYLNLIGNPVTDIEPVRALTQLRTFYVRQTPLTDASPVADLQELRDFRIGASGVTDIAPIAGLPNLLFFSATGQTIADWSPLATLPALEVLGARSSNFSDLSLIAPGAPFRMLFGANSDITDVSPLAGRVSVEYLELGGTPVTDLSPLWGLPNLYFLQFRSTAVADLAGMNLPALTNLLMSNSAVTDLAPLAGAPALERVWFRGVSATDYSILLNLPQLDEIDLRQSTLACTDPVAVSLANAGVNVIDCP